MLFEQLLKVAENGGFPRAGLKFPERQGVEADRMIVSSFLAGCVPCGTGTGTSKAYSPALAK